MLPIQPIAYWVRATLIVASLLLIAIVAIFAITKWLNEGFTIQRLPPQHIATAFLHMCVIAPLLEETIYRLVICVSVTGALGAPAAILLSGAVFAGLHFVYGNPSPDNFLAGYVLAWVYLKSGSIIAPIVLHSLGNSVAIAAQLAAWYAA
jgi:membrane protease YdiL (CAAX protease family)